MDLSFLVLAGVPKSDSWSHTETHRPLRVDRSRGHSTQSFDVKMLELTTDFYFISNMHLNAFKYKYFKK